MEVVDYLGEYAGPVDGVDGAQVEGGVGVGVGKKRLDDVLAVVEGARDGEVVHVLVEDGGHLGLLDGADAALGVQDEHRDVLLASETVDGGTTCVAGSCADNGQVMPICEQCDVNL